MNIVKFKNKYQIDDWITDNPASRDVLLRCINNILNKNLELNDLGTFLENFNLLVLGNIFAPFDKSITLEINKCTRTGLSTEVILFPVKLVINNINLSTTSVTSIRLPINSGRLIYMSVKCYKCVNNCCC